MTHPRSSFRRPVYRTRALPVGQLRGTYLIAEPLLHATRSALTSFADAGRNEGGHEGLVYWAGRESAGTTVFLHAIVPRAQHGPARVSVEAAEVGRMQRALRKHRLALLAQVHSHPGDDTRHSDGDDHLILMPHNEMLSLVAPEYGTQLTQFDQLGVHQFQDGVWVWCTPESIRAGCIVVPSMEDLR